MYCYLYVLCCSFCFPIWWNRKNGCPDEKIYTKKWFEKQWLSMCPISRHLQILVSVFKIKNILYYNPVRVKNKYKMFRFFSSVENQELTFYSKFCRKSTEQVQCVISLWIVQHKKLNKKLWSLYNTSKTKHLVFSQNCLISIKEHLVYYNYTLSLIVADYIFKNKMKIKQNNLPTIISRLQNILIESFYVVIYAIYLVSKSKDRFISGVDSLCFKSLKTTRILVIKQKLKGTRYFYSKKNKKIKKDLPKSALLSIQEEKQLKEQVRIFNFKLCLQLLQKCNIKWFCNQYKINAVKRIWLLKEHSGEFYPAAILTLRDRVLHYVIRQAIFPILEYQADPLSFAYRPKRSAHQALAYIYKHLRSSQKNQAFYAYNTYPQRVTQEVYYNFSGKKAKFRTSNIGQKGKRSRRYLYNYWIYPKKEFKLTCQSITTYYKYLNIELTTCFNSISHQFLLTTIPLTSKYLFFLKTWLVAPIIGSLYFGGPCVTVNPSVGLNQGPLLNYLLFNLILDGIQDYLYFNSLSIKNIYVISKKEKQQKKLFNQTSQKFLSCVRYCGSVFIFGQCTWDVFKKVQVHLKFFLITRGFYLKKFERFSGSIFQPGSQFSYLGFKFVFPNYKSHNLNIGKYTKMRYTPSSLKFSSLSKSTRSSIFILITPKCFKYIKYLLKKQLSRRNSSLPVKMMIALINLILGKSLNYFVIETSIQLQVSYLNHLIYRFFFKYLIQKFKSVPKTFTYIRKKFIRAGSFTEDNFILLKTYQIKAVNLSLQKICPPNWILNSNIYLNSFFFYKNKMS